VPLARWQRRVVMAVALRVAPAHSGEFAALADDGFAADLQGAGADAHAEFAVVDVAHPVGGGFEVAEGLVDVGGFDADQGYPRAACMIASMSPLSRSVSRSSSQASGSGDDEREVSREGV
jgi:hypothetical protein